MATESGKENPAVTPPAGTALTPPSPFSEVAAEMREHPGRFNFFQAVRLLLRMLPERKMIGDFADPRREAVRFHTHNTLAFPPSDIRSIDLNGELPQMSVYFMGLTGPAGVLPYSYSELVAHRIREKDHTLAAFFDIFNHRMISLFYRAWEKYRSAFAFERDGQDRFSDYLFCLIGMGTPGLRERMSIRDESLLFYTGLLSTLPRSATSLEHVIEDYFDVPCDLEQFVGAWQQLDTADQCMFGDGDSLSEQMGVGAVTGDAIWDLQSRIRLKLGPLSRQRYASFLPGGAAYQPLCELARFFCGHNLEVEVQLVLKREEVPKCELGDPDAGLPCLGWTSWVKSGADFDRSPEDTILLLT
jgi:type VI secretion system protein ImpH